MLARSPQKPLVDREKEPRSSRPTDKREQESRSARPLSEETTFARAAARSPPKNPTAALNLGASSRELKKIVKTLGRIDKDDIAVGEVEVAEKDLPDRPPIIPEPFPFVLDRKCVSSREHSCTPLGFPDHIRRKSR